MHRGFVIIISSFLLKFDLDKIAIMDKKPSTLTEAELEQLKAGLKRTYKERFEMATRLYKIQQTMNKATITHKPFINK